MKHHLSFTIGPVQTFVAQARRTRDLWAGSWLLSYLAECALAAAEQVGGQAIIPHRQKPKGITAKQTTVGGIPNRFELRFDSQEQAKQATKKATEAFNSAWQKIASAVFTRYVEPVAKHGSKTREIWNRQVENFWEIAWVIGAPDGDGGTLAELAAQRKNIRNVTAQPENGTKCSLMGTLQEISGHAGRGQWDAQATFWNELRKNVPGLDVQQGERLCAIALIKRLCPHVMTQAIGSDVCRELNQQQSWPSTAFLAALPWLKKVEQSGQANAAAEYAAVATSLGWSESEHHAAKHAGLDAAWAKLDGPAWFAEAVRQNEPGAESTEVESLLKSLKKLHDAIGSRPVPYYALLLMDGDLMGQLVAMLGAPEKVSRRLNQFSSQVDEVLQEKLGRTIYAGGDDVLAVLPAVHALAAADELARRYVASFEQVNDGKPIPEATLSGAIVYAHWKYPLRQVLQTAHHLLDDIAKERTGRDSLAIGIIQGSGLQAVWSAPWAVVRGETDCITGSVGFGGLETVIDRFGSDSTEKETTEFNASFLYLLRQQYGKLFAQPVDQPGEFGQVDFDKDLLVDIANSEYRRRMKKSERDKTPSTETKAKVEPLLALSQRWKRNPETQQVASDPQTFGFDGWRVARLLKQIHDGKAGAYD